MHHSDIVHHVTGRKRPASPSASPPDRSSRRLQHLAPPLSPPLLALDRQSLSLILQHLPWKEKVAQLSTCATLFIPLTQPTSAVIGPSC